MECWINNLISSYKYSLYAFHRFSCCHWCFFLIFFLYIHLPFIIFNRDCGTNPVKWNEKICMLTKMSKLKDFHAYAIQMTMGSAVMRPDHFLRMLHVQRRGAEKMRQQWADDNRFVFVSVQHIFVCILLAYFCDPLLILHFDFNSCACRFLYVLNGLGTFHFGTGMPQMQRAFICARHQNYEMPTINILVHRRKKGKQNNKKDVMAWN